MYKTPGKRDNYIKLIYFNGRGRAEHIRYCFAAADMVYEDCRIKGDEWGSLKPSTVLGFLPQLEVNGEPVAQGLAAGRLAAKLSGLYTSNPMDQAKVDMISETANNFREDMIKAASGKEGEEKLAAIKDQAKIFSKLNDMLPKGVSEEKMYFVGNKLSFADIHFYACTEMAILNYKCTDLMDEWPNLKIVCKNVATRNQGIANYIKRRPKTDF